MQEEEVHDCTGQVKAELGGESFVLFQDHLAQGDAMNELFGDVNGVGFVDPLLFLFQLLLVIDESAIVNIHFGLSLFMLCLLNLFKVLSFGVEVSLELFNVMCQFILLILLQLLVVYLCVFIF